jgi:23S rRNA (adenine2030-N6)-methyltransferase
MKYRHRFHAGNFADVHKHVTLLALIAALQRKDKGFLFLETHAGRGAYDLAGSAGARSTAGGIERLLEGRCRSDELAAYVSAVGSWRTAAGAPRGYPGSPLLACRALRAQDRAVLIEILPEEAHALERELAGAPRMRVEVGDGFELLRAHLPPIERRGLVLIDPPYEARQDFARAGGAIGQILRRFQSAVILLWYPIKQARDTDAWLAELAAACSAPALVSELWLHPCDSEVALNGSGALIVNPPFQIAERMHEWLPELHALLDAPRSGGARVRALCSAT